jgi:hypothetical protein
MAKRAKKGAKKARKGATVNNPNKYTNAPLPETHLQLEIYSNGRTEKFTKYRAAETWSILKLKF